MEINNHWLEYKGIWFLNQTPCVGGGSAGVMIAGAGETKYKAIENAIMKIAREKDMDIFEAMQRQLSLASELLLICKQPINE